MNPVLDVRNLEVKYHTQEGVLKALDDVNFTIMPGEIVGIVGESGCGKSTVASALMRLLPLNGEISQGEINFLNNNLLNLDKEELRKIRGRDLAMIFQDPMTSLNPVFSIKSQMFDIFHSNNGNKFSREQMENKIFEIMEEVGIPDVVNRINDYPHQFSGGMRQRILIAMALLARPSLLIADEPTSALDVTLEAQILDLLWELRHSYNTSILFITHDLGVIAQICDHVLVMYAGRIVEQQETISLFDAPLHPYTSSLLASVPSRRRRGEPLASIPGRVPSLINMPPGCKFAERCSLVVDLCRKDEPKLLKIKDSQVRCVLYGSELNINSHIVSVNHVRENQTKTAGDQKHPSTEILLHLEDVSTHFKTKRSFLDTIKRREPKAVRAVDGINIKIRRGEIIGLVGESGSGKTTMGRTILHLISPTDGSITYEDQNITDLNSTQLRKLRSRIQMVFQDPTASLSPRMRVYGLLEEPYKIHKIPEKDQYSVSDLLEMVGLSAEIASKYPHELSGGQARRVGIARSLALQPEFLVADEPTAGLDVSVASSILNLMKELANELDLTYLIITHNLNIVGYIADRIAVMYLGRLVEVGFTDQIFDNQLHPYTKALLSSISEPDPRTRISDHSTRLRGEIPSPSNPPSGCHFHPRCPFVEDICIEISPPSIEVESDHLVTCHLFNNSNNVH